MIGNGTPSSQSNAPLPKPVVRLLCDENLYFLAGAKFLPSSGKHVLEQQGADLVALAADPIGGRIEEIWRPGGIGQVRACMVKEAQKVRSR
jgi:hypothetical protein